MFAAESAIVISFSENCTVKAEGPGHFARRAASNSRQLHARSIRPIREDSIVRALVRVYILAKNKKVPLFERVAAIKVATLFFLARSSLFSRRTALIATYSSHTLITLVGLCAKFQGQFSGRKSKPPSIQKRLNCAIIMAPFNFGD
jgi:hypothetical protein